MRKTVYSFSNMVTHFERFMDLIGKDLYAEDLTVYSAIPSGSTNNITQIRNYIRDRLTYCDEEFANMISDEGGEDTPTEKTLTSISATYSGGDVTVGTELTDLVNSILVTANYSDGTSQTVIGYELSGSINEGSNTITVTYQGKTTTFTVVGFVELVDDGIDYTLNPLANVETYVNTTYDNTTGEKKTVNNEFCTDKFTLQNCMYSLSVKGGTYLGIFVWDENDNFINAFEVNTIPSPFKFIAVSNYKYALKVYNATVKDNTTFSLMPVDNRRTMVDTFSLDLSKITFGTGTKFEADVTEVFNENGISNVNEMDTKLKTTNCFIALSKTSQSKLSSKNKKSNFMAFSIYDYNGKILLENDLFSSADSLNEYCQTNNVVLTFNG